MTAKGKYKAAPLNELNTHEWSWLDDEDHENIDW